MPLLYSRTPVVEEGYFRYKMQFASAAEQGLQGDKESASALFGCCIFPQGTLHRSAQRVLLTGEACLAGHFSVPCQVFS